MEGNVQEDGGPIRALTLLPLWMNSQPVWADETDSNRRGQSVQSSVRAVAARVLIDRAIWCV